jgi:hypothetical protein
MQKTDKEKFYQAQRLADFANLKPEGVPVFRRRECGESAGDNAFVPSAWLDYRPTDSTGIPFDKKLWQINQEWLFDAWKKEFQIGQLELMKLITSVFDPSTAFLFEPPERRPAFVTISDMPSEMYPYQQAIMFLYEQPWRVRLCRRCKSPFVASHNQAKYCGVKQDEEDHTCASLSRSESQQKDTKKHRDERNKRRRKKYAQQKRMLVRKKLAKKR